MHLLVALPLRVIRLYQRYPFIPWDYGVHLVEEFLPFRLVLAPVIFGIGEGFLVHAPIIPLFPI